MASSSTSNIYIHVIEDVINKVRDEFIHNGGPREGVLTELQGLWELKMMQAGAISGTIDRSAIHRTAAGGLITANTVHDLNVPYEGAEEYETPTADLLFPPTPLQTPMAHTPLPGMAHTPLPGMAHTPLPGMAQTPLTGSDGSTYDGATGANPVTPNDFSSVHRNGVLPDVRTGLGRPNPYMQPPSSWLSQRSSLDVNIAYMENQDTRDRRAFLQSAQNFLSEPSGKRKREDFSHHYHAGGHIPQQDGAGDILVDVPEVVQESIKHMTVKGVNSSSRISQLDGPIPDPYDDVLSTPNIYNYQGVVSEDYNIVNTPAPNEILAATPAPVPNEAGDADDDESLNEDDDDELDDVDDGEDLNTTHLILAQFDKVTRTKSRWKCALKDGIMHINNNDILFNKAMGEFEF